MRHTKRSGAGIVLLLILSVLILGGTWLYTTWRSSEAVLPATLTINGLSVAGMTRDQALVAIEQAYTIPITVTYAGQVIGPLLPESIELRVDIQATAQNLDETIASGSGGLAFAQYLFDTVRGREPAKTVVPAVVLYSRERVDAFLQRTAQKYDHPPLGPVALPESGTFRPAAEGTTLNSEASLPLLISAILSPDPAKREVALVVATEPAPEVSLDILEQALTAALAGFRGVFSIYAKDLESGSELCLQCDVAHTGISTIEVATALEIYRMREIPLDNETAGMIDVMLATGDSTAADGLLSALGGGDFYSGAQQVTDGLWSLGLRNTFVSAPLSTGGAETTEASITTPANTRTDLATQPSPTVQSTAVDIGILVESLYHCAQGGGMLRALYPRAITPLECEELLGRMHQSSERPLLLGALPTGMRVAHTRSIDGSTYAEAALVYGPGTPFVLAVLMYQPEWLLVEESEPTFSQIGMLTYRFFSGEPETLIGGAQP